MRYCDNLLVNDINKYHVNNALGSKSCIDHDHVSVTQSLLLGIHKYDVFDPANNSTDHRPIRMVFSLSFCMTAEK